MVGRQGPDPVRLYKVMVTPLEESRRFRLVVTVVVLPVCLYLLEPGVLPRQREVYVEKP